MKNAKVITICGSLNFRDEMMRVSEELELQRNCVLSVIYPVGHEKDNITEDQAKILFDMHKQKIRMSDAIFVVNVGGYIGSGVKSEIDYAKGLGKEILYLENKNEM